MHHLAGKYQQKSWGSMPPDPPSCRCLRHLLLSHSPPPSQNPGYGPAPPPLLTSNTNTFPQSLLHGIPELSLFRADQSPSYSLDCPPAYKFPIWIITTPHMTHVMTNAMQEDILTGGGLCPSTPALCSA